jgi:hypothetical protein
MATVPVAIVWEFGLTVNFQRGSETQCPDGFSIKSKEGQTPHYEIPSDLNQTQRSM